MPVFGDGLLTIYSAGCTTLDLPDFESIRGIQLFYSHLIGEGRVHQTASACEQKGGGGGQANVNIYTSFSNLVPSPRAT